MFKGTCLRWVAAQSLQKLDLEDSRTDQLLNDIPEKHTQHETSKNSTPNSTKTRQKPYKKILHVATNILTRKSPKSELRAKSNELLKFQGLNCKFYFNYSREYRIIFILKILIMTS